MRKCLPLLLLCCCLAPLACSDEGGPGPGLPQALPFSYARPDVGQALSPTEITAFTEKITGLWKRVDYFSWVYETCHGVDASTGQPDYLLWWHDVDAVKEGDTITFRNNSAYGGSHNNAEPTGLVLSQAIGGYLLTGDEAMGRVVEQFAKSITATMKGFVYDESDPLPYIMSRNIVTQNHAFVLPSGKKKAVDYSDWYFAYEGWNANRVHYPNNPSWGDIWVTTMRSKDDLPYLYRPTAWLPYVIEASDDPAVVAACQEALDYMKGFARDVVDSGYYIRSKDGQGQAYIPEEDLASFNDYVDLFPGAECDPRLASALLAYGDPLGIDCGDGQGSDYDSLAGQLNYYNYSIVDGFHLNALHLALIQGRAELAERLLRGLALRIERYRDPLAAEPGWQNADWERDIALLLLMSASLGLPLTSDEARQVQRFHARAADDYADFPNFDLWAETVPDGVYGFRDGFHPRHRPEAIRIEDVAFILEYCWSPFRNPTGAAFVDCDVVRDPDRWGG